MRYWLNVYYTAAVYTVLSFYTGWANCGHPRNVYQGPVLDQVAQRDVVRGSHQQSRADWQSCNID
jgi:hypothetical protein